MPTTYTHDLMGKVYRQPGVKLRDTGKRKSFSDRPSWTGYSVL